MATYVTEVATMLLRAGRDLVFRILDVALLPFTFASSVWLKAIRKHGVSRLHSSKRVFDIVGVFPILDHYYEPLFKSSHLHKSLRMDRPLPGIDMNVEEQLETLKRFHYNDELLALPRLKRADTEFGYDFGPFRSGDAEYLYNMIRWSKPGRIVEVGSGESTLLTRQALNQNRRDDPSYICNHICIEPFEHQWLERIGVTVVRREVQKADRHIFASLDAGDILFIDSSHVLRPQGDVVTEYLEILPMLKSGVLVHIHDIFTPKDYLDEWILDDVKLWNEQYLVEAFLSFNWQFKIVGALNYLKHNYSAELRAKCPVLDQEFEGREPGSLWIRRV
jgi:hypothetical protein